MRSSALPLQTYDSDKISNRYLERYDPVFEPYVQKNITLLELGVKKGGSLLLWHDYFSFGTIVGIDIDPPKDFHPPDRVQVFRGSQADPAFLSMVATSCAPAGFDIIIDDASHYGDLTKVGFWHLFDNHLRPGGLYVIEDWGTGYWDDWPDGRSLDLDRLHASVRITNKNSMFSRVTRQLGFKSAMPCHSYGMVGFVKQLVDEQAAQDVTRKNWSGKPQRESKFAELLIVPSIVFVRKAG